MTDKATESPPARSGPAKVNGAQQNDKKPEQQPVDANADNKAEPSPAELKKQRKAEKQARRAQGREGAGASTEAGPSTQPAQRSDADKSKAGDKHKRSGSSSGPRQGQSLPTRRRPSQTGARDNAPASSAQSQSQQQQQQQQKPKPPRQVSFLSHLYPSQPRRHTTADAGKDVHPAILTLAQQMAHYAICGSHARTVAMLLALKSVIATYTTPVGTSLPRHLSTHFLSPQLTHLKSHGRPFCSAQSAAIRWLKNAIATLDPSLPEHEAKNRVLSSIDTFVRERFAVADEVIATEVATSWISDGDVVLTFGKSAVVTRALREAVRRGRTFRVLVADARPLHEGRALAQSLRALRPRDSDDDDDDDDDDAEDTTSASKAGAGAIRTTYTPLSSLPTALAAHPPTKAILGAHTVLSNGAVQARAGTALAALAARDAGAPVLVLAESVKFAERGAVDALGGNEVAPEEEIGPEGWSSVQGLSVANVVYDVTPAALVSAVVTELGTLPAGAAPSVVRMVGGAGEGVV